MTMEDLHGFLKLEQQVGILSLLYQTCLQGYHCTGTVTSLCIFLLQLDYSIDAVRQLIHKYEPSSDHREQHRLSFNGFLFLMNSQMMNGRNYEHSEIYQDMTQPLSHYYISSSHNTLVNSHIITFVVVIWSCLLCGLF